MKASISKNFSKFPSKFKISGSLIMNLNNDSKINLDAIIQEAEKNIDEQRQKRKEKEKIRLRSGDVTYVGDRSTYESGGCSYSNKENKENSKDLSVNRSGLSHLYQNNNNLASDINLNARIREIRRNMEKSRTNRALERKINNNIAFDKNNIDVVFESYKILNDFRKEKNNKLQEEENIVSAFITQNKEISIKNVMINILRNEGQKLADLERNRERKIKSDEFNLKSDENNFNSYANMQKSSCKNIENALNELYLKNRKLAEEEKIYRSEVKVTQDEMKKYLELIENLRVCARFVTRVMGEDSEMFPQFKSPDMLEDDGDDVEKITEDVLHKYSRLLEGGEDFDNKKSRKFLRKLTDKKSKNMKTLEIDSKLSRMNTNKDNKENKAETLEVSPPKEMMITTSSNKNTIVNLEELFKDPEFMFRKFVREEDRILHLLQLKEYTDNEINAITSENDAALRDLKERYEIQKKEYAQLQNELAYEKKHEMKNTNSSANNLKELEGMIIELNNCLNDGEIAPKKTKMKKEIQDLVKEATLKLENKERKLYGLLVEMEKYEKEDKALLNEVISERKNENKEAKQIQTKKKLEESQLKRKIRTEERFQRVIIKSRKTEPPFQKVKKIKVVKEDPELIKQQEDLEILLY